MPCGIRPSNVRVCHSTTRAGAALSARICRRTLGLASALVHPKIRIKRTRKTMSELDNDDWIKIDLHIHTLDDPKDVIDYSAHELLERARQLGFRVLAITLHDAVFDRPEVFKDAAAMGILLISAAEMRLQGADIILLNVTANEVAALKNFDDVRRLRA